MALRDIDLFLLLFFFYKVIPTQSQYILSSGLSTLSNSGISTLPGLGLALSPGLSGLPSVGLPLTSSVTNLPNVGLSSLSQALLPSNGLSFQTVPNNFITTGLPTKQALITQPGLPSLTLAPPTSGSCSLNPPSTKEGMDNEVLNNLAIALQLLIVSNLLNTPLPENLPGSPNSPLISQEPLPPLPYSVSYAPSSLPPLSPNLAPAQLPPTYYQLPTPPSSQQPTYYQLPPAESPPVIQNPAQYYPTYEASPTVSYPPPATMPNANFVGSASYSDGSNVLTSFAGPYASSGCSTTPARPPRASLALMSPYDAIAPTSPYSDPILSSPYGSIITSSSDFKSPYSTFDMSKDFY